MIAGTVGYRVEGGTLESSLCEGEEDKQEVFEKANANAESLFEDVFDLGDKDNYAKFYKEQIMCAAHTNFLCFDSPRGPVSVSVCDDSQDGKYISLHRTSEGNIRTITPYDSVSTSWWRRLFGFGPSWSDVFRAIDPSLPTGYLRKITDPRLPQALLSFEEQQQIKGFKFGILYASEGQTREDEMFANVETSKEFEEFLDFLGDRVPLQGWKGFRGGLDVRSGTTGSHSLYTKFNNNEIMFHVSTLLPFNPKDKQQLERKRHIGNDIVNILFLDGRNMYKPTTISSRQVQVVIVIQPTTIPEDPDNVYYRMGVVSKSEVPDFGPPLNQTVVFRKDDDFRNFLYAKLLNAERASYRAPILDNKLSRTRIAMLKDICQTFGVS